MANRKKIIVAAWKAYLTRADTQQVAEGLKDWRENKSKKLDYDIVLSPSFPYLIPVNDIVENTDISLSAQDVDPVTLGAFTGHIPPQILQDVGCKYVILGHSELRHLKNNDYSSIHEKVKSSLENGLKVILCIGETLKQKEANQTYGTLKNQVESAIKGIDEKFMKDNLGIAYEPVWAISSQEPTSPPTPKKINVINGQLRTLLERHLSKDTAETVRLLYGGSVNAENVCSYLNEELVDGVLVGGASTKSNSFIQLLDAVEDKVALTT